VIPAEIALKLCQEIRKKNRGKWYSFYGVWCNMWVKFSKGDVAKLCFSSRADNRGYGQVNGRWDKDFN
jgi:hypothetical protein